MRQIVDGRIASPRAALDLAEWGIANHRARLRRRRPEATDEELDALLRAWLAGG